MMALDVHGIGICASELTFTVAFLIPNQPLPAFSYIDLKKNVFFCLSDCLRVQQREILPSNLRWLFELASLFQE